MSCTEPYQRLLLLGPGQLHADRQYLRNRNLGKQPFLLDLSKPSRSLHALQVLQDATRSSSLSHPHYQISLGVYTPSFSRLLHRLRLLLLCTNPRRVL
ncbi:hypothetical protein RvY_08202 [Ramazzottius varieornatus]|uniref:Uncharacterized protein n=1 Tax=Ramazzottius varieornatus TaxID=947166 RepID=A0A1D1VAQ2_RAMVA|nr:hypothetical protein RvY_08202 [Ramazzottius varieornatus]